MRADEAPGLAAEALLEDVRPVHRIVLSQHVHGDAAEVEPAGAGPARLDDAPPEEGVRRVGRSSLLVRSRTLVDLAVAAAPEERARHRAAVALRQPDARVTCGDQRPPRLAVVVGGPRDESGAPASRRVELVERAQVRLAGGVADRHAALLSLADAPAGVLVERAEERVLAR